MNDVPLVSYVIGVRNMENTIGITIESILNQNYPNKQVIVINDGSDDNTEIILKKYPIKYIKTEKIGISNARNLGFNNSSGDFIAFTDADCILDKNWTRNMIHGFIDSKIGLVGARIELKTDGSISSIYRKIELSKRQNNIKNKEVVYAGGAGLMFRRKVLEEIGGFNPKWIHAEDSEISFLTISHGYRIIRQNDAITYHIPESGFKKIIKKGLRDSKAYVRATKSHLKTSFNNKFNTTWYFPYDMVILPLIYLLIIVSIIFLPIIFVLNLFIRFADFIFNIIWIYYLIIILFVLLLLIYSFIPAYQCAKCSQNKKIRVFLGIIILHNVRGLAWGIGLIVGIKKIIFQKIRV